MILIDDYFEDVECIRKHALQAEYRDRKPTENWRGYRSAPLSISNKLEESIIENIKNTIENKTNRKIARIDVYFHCSPDFILNEEKNFHEMKWHKDCYDYAGVIYITPNPPPNTGTCFKNAECVENKYNRFLGYSAEIEHAPDNLFGQDINSTRLNVTFFTLFIDGKYYQKVNE